jgi:hypothetical protein
MVMLAFKRVLVARHLAFELLERYIRRWISIGVVCSFGML